ncbi:MAG: TonB-dependent receptor [Acidobacteriota bacterium]|nr:TonB-dependent receptor [Acidobacteriota bacterium]
MDDVTWVSGNHTISTGANIRLISNRRTSFGSSFDNASTNPSFYDFSGDVVINDDNGDPIFSDVSSASSIDLRDALTAVIGRFSQYGVNLQYGKDGRLLPLGEGISRNFKTEEYEAYIQDSWRIRNSLTVNYGVRWSTSTPVYEANGLQVKPTTSLSDFFDRRVAAAFNGQSNNELLSVDLAGKANNRPGYYKQDWNNFAPAVSAAWSPNFKSGIFNRLFGEGKSTIRGGFRMTYDRIGSALAVAFDLNSTLGFSSTRSVAANTFNVSTNLGPLFTGIGQNYRSATFFPSLPNTISFPLQTPADEDPRIEQSLDDKLTTPYNYNYNLSYGRDLGKGYAVEVSYVGRIAKKLLVSRDSAHFNNLRDPASGADFYSTIRRLVQYREANSPITAIPNIAWVQRFLPGLAGTYRINGVPTVLTASQAAYRRVARSCSNNAPRDDNGNCPAGTVSINGRNTTDYTFVQLLWDDGLGFGDNLFIHPQYATFAAYSTLGSSDYNGLQVSFRKRFRSDLQFDINYTYSHSFDDASGNESSGTISSGASLILNPLDLRENRASSDFDVRHLVNANFIYGLPFGNGKMLFGNSKGLADKIIGGWQLTGIFRFNTGFPIGQPFDDGRWATNWNVQSNGVAVRRVETSPTRSGEPNLFSDPQAAYSSYRNALPGEQGDRNILREPSYIVLDAGLYKAFTIAERHKITFRLEVFNVANTQRFTGIANFALSQDPNTPGSQGATAPADFGRFTQIQGKPRTVQFAVRYDF